MLKWLMRAILELGEIIMCERRMSIDFLLIIIVDPDIYASPDAVIR